MTTPDENEERRSQLKSKLFGPEASTVPRVLIELLDDFGVATLPTAVFERDVQSPSFGIFWLRGELFHRLQFSGWEQTAKATHDVYPLDRLTDISTAFTFEWDDVRNLHTRTHRKVTLSFERAEPIVLDIRADAQAAATQTELVDAVFEVFGAK